MIRGESCAWQDNFSEQDFIEYAQSQGVLLLLANSVDVIEKQWPEPIYKAVLIAQSAADNLLEHRREIISDLFEKLNHRQLTALLFKGSANAYLIYPSPKLRQHADVDIMIKENDYQQVVDVLEDMGFEIDSIKPTKFGPYQTTAILKQQTSPNLILDLHWKINNRLLLADALSFNEAWHSALPVKEYGDSAYGFNHENALLACCIHEAGSLPVEREKLIGLYDAYLLMSKLGELGISDMLENALSKDISVICIDYLTKSMDLFADEGQKKMLNDVISNLSENSQEHSAGFLKPQRNWLEEQKLDWSGVNGISNKIEYIVSKIVKKLAS